MNSMQGAIDGKKSGGTARLRPTSPWRKRMPRTLLNKIAEGTWICGDPGMQYDGSIQKWHTCKGTNRSTPSIPCSEYVFLNNTAAIWRR